MQYNQDSQFYRSAYGQVAPQESMLGGMNQGFIHPLQHDVASLDSLALEFGVDAELVHALAQRLAGGSLPSPAITDPGQRQHMFPRFRGQ